MQTVSRDRTEYHRQWYARNRDKKIAQSKANYSANRERRLEQGKEYRKLNPEVPRKAWRKHHRLHGDKCRKANREWYQRNIGEQRERSRRKGRKIYAADPRRLLDAGKKWRDANKHHISARDAHRRALVSGATVNLSSIREWMASVKSRPFALCYWCDKTISSRKIHFDHIVALAKGGAHSVDNLCVACAKCNLSKKDKTVSAWIRIGQQTLAL